MRTTLLILLLTGLAWARPTVEVILVELDEAGAKSGLILPPVNFGSKTLELGVRVTPWTWVVRSNLAYLRAQHAARILQARRLGVGWFEPRRCSLEEEIEVTSFDRQWRAVMRPESLRIQLEVTLTPDGRAYQAVRAEVNAHGEVRTCSSREPYPRQATLVIGGLHPERSRQLVLLLLPPER